ncbi:hypothetical protein [Ruminococcus sp.]
MLKIMAFHRGIDLVFNRFSTYQLLSLWKTCGKHCLPANYPSEAGSASSQHQMSESCANTQTPVLNVCKKRKRSAASGESPLTLRPNFNCEKGNVTAAAAACMPRRGSFVDRKMLYLRVMHLPYSTGETRTLFFFCFFFSFQQRKKEA